MGEREASDCNRHSGPVTRTLRNLKAASKEFSAAVRWYEEQRPGLGGEFFDAVVHATSLIEVQPENWHAVSRSPDTACAGATISVSSRIPSFGRRDCHRRDRSLETTAWLLEEAEVAEP